MRHDRHRSIIVAIITLLLLSTVPPSSAGGSNGSFMLSANGNGFYDAHEWPELFRSLVTIAVVLANDEDEWDYDDRDHYDPDSYCDEDLGISIPQSQFDIGLSYFVSPSLAVGGRYLYSEDYHDDELTRVWGGGPEATFFLGRDPSRTRPFVGGGLIYTRGRSRLTSAPFEDGTALHWRAGLHIPMGSGAGFVIQGGWRDDAFPLEADPFAGQTSPRMTRRIAGLGFGFTARIN
ncbi:MAG: hypothetical protein HOH74_18215 [Gemmatimonadetes bacterium]|nr:hypothetical protein [Gemmatimonadota bacterium]